MNIWHEAWEVVLPSVFIFIQDQYRNIFTQNVFDEGETS